MPYEKNVIELSFPRPTSSENHLQVNKNNMTYEKNEKINITCSTKNFGKLEKLIDSKTEGEITAAKRLCPTVNLRNAVVTGEALHCERQSMQLIVEADGDFLFQVKRDQPTAMAEARRVIAGGSPLLPATARIAGTAG